MEPAEVIDTVVTALADLKADGRETVAIEALERFLQTLRADAGKSTERQRLEYQRVLAHYDAQVKHNLEMFKSVMDAGREALNSLVLINGGAIIALLGFMGAAISKDFPKALGASLTFPLLYFGTGVLMGALAFGIRYLAQAAFALQRMNIGYGFNILSIVLAISGYALFGCAIYYAFRAFVIQFAA